MSAKAPMPRTGPVEPVTRADIENAAARIGPYIRRTPVMEVDAEALGLPVWLKLEFLQHSGSFKSRPAFSRMLAGEIAAGSGVIAASGGNFGLGVAYAAKTLGHPAEIFVPDTTPEVKPNRMRELGATVRIVPGYYANALEASMERAETTGALLLHAYDQPEVVAGDGTIGMEISEQVPDADTVLVAVGGAGLIGGIAGWFADEVRVIGVEPERCPSLHEALRAGRPVDVEVGGIAADSLGAARVGEHGFASARRYVDLVVLVSDEHIRAAQGLLWERLRILAEPGAAAAVAAITSGAYRPEPGERVVVLICGANFDPSALTSSRRA